LRENQGEIPASGESGASKGRNGCSLGANHSFREDAAKQIEMTHMKSLILAITIALSGIGLAQMPAGGTSGTTGSTTGTTGTTDQTGTQNMTTNGNQATGQNQQATSTNQETNRATTAQSTTRGKRVQNARTKATKKAQEEQREHQQHMGQASPIPSASVSPTGP